MTIYDFTVKDALGNLVPMQEYKGKALLIVNTATSCGFTPQYKGLQQLYDDYRDRGFEILDFPSNQFANQSPWSETEIIRFCQLNYGTTFRTFAKTDVNGANAEPLFAYLRRQTPGFFGNAIKWNFTKFLVARDGSVVKRFAPTTEPEKIRTAIERQLDMKEYAFGA